MIFDNDEITSLVISWQCDKNPDTLSKVMSGSNALIEAIVSIYDYDYRDDLIQESCMKVIKALAAFDPAIATLHTYLTTVIRNACISWLTKNNTSDICVDDIDVIGSSHDDKNELADTLTELIAHNRQRFGSLPSEVVDEITESIFFKLRDGVVRSKIVTIIAERLGYDRSIVSAIYTSSLIFLRSRYIQYRQCNMALEVEFTMLPEVKALLGEGLYRQFLVLFSGFSIRVP